MAVQLDFVFESAFSAVKRTLEQGNLAFSSYNSNLRNYAILRNFNICNVGRDNSDASNMTLSLDYTITLPDDNGCLMTYEKSRQINLLCTLGDCDWTHNMIDYVWNGDYPSTIGIDINTGDVFLVYLRNTCLELRYFSVLDNNQLSRFDEDVNLSRPFKLKVDERALFLVLDGCEGYNHLKENVYIEFNSIPPMRVELAYCSERIC
jgi:hypothetical protein